MQHSIHISLEARPGYHCRKNTCSDGVNFLFYTSIRYFTLLGSGVLSKMCIGHLERKIVNSDAQEVFRNGVTLKK